jgi:DNA-binding LacI/PurR family transcriptional regulator
MAATKKKTSIYSISKEVGVSPATVSRALNNHPSVSADIRAKIQQIAEEKNFKPRFISNRVTNLCVLIQQYDGHPLDFDAFVAQSMEGIAQYCRHEEIEMSLYSAHIRELNECDIVRELRRRNADGVIILRANAQTEYLSQMEKQRFPYFCLLCSDNKSPDRFFFPDDEKLAEEAVTHLISLGHRHIGILINAPFSRTCQNRLKGYTQALQKQGITLNDQLIFKTNPKVCHGGFKIGVEGIQQLLERDPKMTAIFTTDDSSAQGALCWLYEHQIKVPDRISVVGFDDFPEMAYTCPPLTTVRIPYLNIGYEVARQVHRLYRGLPILLPDEVREKLAGELVIRKSTGPVARV